jgi:hypothetical protein
MRWRVLVHAALFSALFVAPASGQGIFSKKKTPKPNPAERLAQLITTLKTDQDEANRESAANELRQFDTKLYPEVISVLIETLQNDPRPAVRMEAAESLGRIRPISQQAGWALEQAASKDSSTRVRFQARSSLLLYRIWGYRSDAKPPDEQPPSPPPEPAKPNLPMPKPARPGAPPSETAPPPLAFPLLPAKQSTPTPPKPQPPKPQPPPPPSKDQGPDLLPPDR